MINFANWNKNAHATAKYFDSAYSQGDYHDEHQQVTGEWWGKGATALGLVGHVEREVFVRVLDGKHPATGKNLGPRQIKERRTHKDIVFSAPKSVSLLAALGAPSLREKIERAHMEACRAAMSELEKYACARERRKGAESGATSQTGTLVCAFYLHSTSRPVDGHFPDPQLHTHSVTANLTRTGDGRIMALEDSYILAHQKEASAVYDAHLSAALTNLGFVVERDGKSWRIAKVSREAEKLFSKRHDHIARITEAKAAEIERKTGNRPSREEIAEIVAHRARSKKPDAVHPDRMRADWRRQLKEAGQREDGLVAVLSLTSAHSVTKTKPMNVRRAVRLAVEHLSEREAVVSVSAVIEEAVKRSLGSGIMPAQIKAEITRLVKRKSLLRSGDQLSTVEALADEQKLLADARSGKGKVRPILNDCRLSEKLSPEQAQAARLILNSRDRTSIIRGPAGTGKSSLLREIVDQTELAGKSVIITAPMGRQARALRTEGFEQAQTVAKLLLRPVPPGAVVICDEAGQTSAKDLIRLQSAVAAARGRLILVGDARQHGSVARGDALRHMERDSGVTLAELSSIRRQDANRGRNIAERNFISKYREAAQLASLGKAQESFDLLDKLGAINQVDDPVSVASKLALEKAKDGGVLVVTQTRLVVDLLNSTIRAKRIEEGQVEHDGVERETFSNLNASMAERGERSSYKPGMLLVFVQKHGDISRGDVARVEGIREESNQLILSRAGGQTRRVGLSHAGKWQLVEQKTILVAAGDQLLLGQNAAIGRGKEVANGEVVSVKSINESGEITLQDGRVLPSSYRQFSHGYASTSFSGQGRTVENVVIVDSGNRAATSARQWYTDVTRARRSAIVLTADKCVLRDNIGHSGESKLASDQNWKRLPSGREKLLIAAKRAGRRVADVAIAALQKAGLSPLLATLQKKYKRSSAIPGMSTRHLNKITSHGPTSETYPSIPSVPVIRPVPLELPRSREFKK